MEVATSRCGDVPLHVASEIGSAGCVRLLLKAGATVESKDFKGNTPLHAACRYGHVPCIRLLLQAGANLEAANDSRESPLHVAS